MTDLSTKLASVLEKLAEEEKTAIVATVGFLKRNAINIVWPFLLSLIPKLADKAITSISVHFGTMNVNDLLAFISKQIKDNPNAVDEMK